MNEAAQLLFDYLKDAWNQPDRARLDADALPEDFRELGEGLICFVEGVLEVRAFAKALSRGDLSAAPPGRQNELAAPLKALQASLRHMTWQSQQVAKGDYRQRLEFMGEFAEAFNTMTGQLSDRQAALESQIERIRAQSAALEQSNRVFQALTEGMVNWIAVVDSNTGERLFANRAARDGLEGKIGADVWNWLVRQARTGAEPRARELIASDGASVVTFSVTSHMLPWNERTAVAYMLSDVSDERKYLRELESRAYLDPLTQLNSRYYGMRTLSAWLGERRRFTLCFVDLDNLKYVNDTFGHAEGDRFLVAAADAIRQLSPDGVCVRLGGDEFMVLVPYADAEEVARDMEALRARLAAPRALEPAPYLRSISYGVVEVGEDNALPSSELLGLADERMYEYKRAQKKARKAQLK
ncbi:MAG: diguanylate cyclase [Clostridiales bacterium]|jgi:diguanylate cyclase (GGDEF)-like protein|nr:diguanylate cyclase [Clostridiales bacterium]